MTIIKENIVDKIEVLEMGQVQVRLLVIKEDGTELSTSFHRHVIKEDGTETIIMEVFIVMY